MFDWIAGVTRDLRNFMMGLPVGQRISFVLAVLILAAASASLWFWVQQPHFQTLFSNLEEGDAAAIVAYLKDEKVPYRIIQGGSVVQVPGERVLETRLVLAGKGLPQGGGVGFEIFDKQTLGMTDFVQRLNFQRALQGELARTISQLRQVEGARVHLVLPERSLFSGENVPPAASVVLMLKGGRALRRAQIRGIAHLVAASVRGLNAADVTIVDMNGNLLSGSGQEGEEGTEGHGLLALKRRVEGDYEHRIESMLERVLGKGKAIARVTVSLDLTRVEKTEVTLDPDGTVVGSEKRLKETTVGGAPSAGVPGVASNITNQPELQASEQSGPRSQREDEAIEYEISRTTSHITEPMGGIKRLSVAVLIDGTYKEEGKERVFVPRPDEEISQFRELVKRAVGFDEERGDEIEVTSAPFEVPPTVEVEPPDWRDELQVWAQPAYRVLGVLALLAVMMFIIRPFLLSLARRPSLPRATAAGAPMLGRPQAVQQLTAGEPPSEAETVEFAKRHPDRAAQLIKHWMIEHGG